MSRRPGVDLALFVQTGLARLPGEHVHVERPEDAGRRDLIVLHVTRLHPHGLGATWRRGTNSAAHTPSTRPITLSPLVRSGFLSGPGGFFSSAVVFCCCKRLTCEFAAQQLHAQGAVSSTDLGVDAHVLTLDGRGEGVGGGGVVVHVAAENLEEGTGRREQ